jgi:hypothetical protein
MILSGFGDMAAQVAEIRKAAVKINNWHYFAPPKYDKRL